MKFDNVWEKYDDAKVAEVMEFCEGYKDFLSKNKTERECADSFREMAEKDGYRDLDKLIASGAKLGKGDKVYRVNMGKSIVMFNIGEDPIEDGMNILGAHIDSPRMDVKQNPLYESDDLAYLDTHYYGGIKKYQWVALPLAIHGVFAKPDGEVVKVNIGEDPGDPIFFVSDLLIHLAQEQMVKKAATVVEGEALDIIVGGRPLKIKGKAECKLAETCEAKDESCAAEAKDEEKKDAKDGVKDRFLELLKEKYGVTEEDFVSAELEVVPAGPARDAGLDRSMILSYGQDDRVCAYTSYVAMANVKDVKRTSCCILVDKEEIGSVGATGMESRFFENTVAELIALLEGESDLTLKRCLANSNMLSSDVSAGFDPTYASAFEKKNASFLGRGMVFNKFTGSRGKGGSNDANAEYIGHLRDVLAKDDVAYQTAELGRVDLGGGGTIAYILALYGMNVIDSGIAVLNMHAPWEATSKADVYETERGYEAFLKYAKKLG